MKRTGHVAAALAACGLAAAACGGDAPAELGTVRAVVTPAAAGSAEPNLAVGPDGAVYLTWVEPGADSAAALRFARMEGDGWGPPRTIASGKDWFVNWADFPSLAVLPDGRMAAHWLRRSGADKYAYDVNLATSTDGGATWSAPVVPHRDGVAAEHGFVSLFPLPGDSLGAVWLDGRRFVAGGDGPGTPAAEEMTLAFTAYDRAGAQGAEQRLDARICDCCQTSAAITSRGPVVVFRDRLEGEVRDISIVRRVDGAWTQPAPVHRDGWVMPSCPVNGPAVAARDARVAVAWFTAGGDQPRVQLAFSTDAGATFGAPVRIDGGAAAGRVDVEMLDDGAALVTWMEDAGGGSAEVRVRRVAADGTAGPPATLAKLAAGRASGFPRMVRAGDRIVFAWTEPGTPSRVHTAVAPLGGAE